MKLWIDAQLSPALAPWINSAFSDIQASSAHLIGLRDAEDQEIFYAARAADAVMAKDSDFVQQALAHR